MRVLRNDSLPTPKTLDILNFSADVQPIFKGCALPGNTTCRQVYDNECPKRKWDGNFNCNYSTPIKVVETLKHTRGM